MNDPDNEEIVTALHEATEAGRIQRRTITETQLTLITCVTGVVLGSRMMLMMRPR